MIPENFRKTLDSIVLLFLMAVTLFCLYGIATGLPITIGGWSYRAKNFKILVLSGLIAWFLHLLLHRDGPKVGLLRFKKHVEQAIQNKAAIWILYGVFALLFTWQQITEYLSIKINFLPFSFYDYTLHYFFQGKVHFTGWLHGYYHHNIVMFLLAPLWKLWQSPLLLVLIYGFIASACIFPLYAIARERFKEPLAPFTIALTFLNYRYLQNVIQMNFSVEICYPLFIFSAVYFAMKRRWPLYYLFLTLLLFVKEDSFIYGVAVGVFTFFYRNREHLEENGVHRWQGIVSGVLAIGYYVFLRMAYSPLIGSDIMFGNAANYAAYGESFLDIALTFARSPWLFFAAFLGSGLKIEVLMKILSRVLFLPIFSPAFGLILIPLLPLFLHNTGRDNDFVEMRFHYAAAVIPFIFIAATFGFSNLVKKIPARWTELCRWVLCIALIAINVGHYRTEKISAEDLTSISWAKEVPPGVLLTHGHLLPYAGYRLQNFFFAESFMLVDHPAHKAYENPDFILIDLNVNPYPMDRQFFERKIAALKLDPAFQLIKEDRDIRYLFKRIVPNLDPLPAPGYIPLNEMKKTVLELS